MSWSKRFDWGEATALEGNTVISINYPMIDGDVMDDAVLADAVTDAVPAARSARRPPGD